MRVSRPGTITSAAELAAYVDAIGILPLLAMGLRPWSAQEMASPEAQYHTLPDDGWEWPLWEWKGQIIQSIGCAYGKFIDRKATFISRRLWPDFCNWRRYVEAPVESGSLEELILYELNTHGAMTTRQLRLACGFVSGKERGRFDTYVSRLEMGARVVAEDFVFSVDGKKRPYGWGSALLTTPEALFGPEDCSCQRTPEESRQRLIEALSRAMPWVEGDTFFRRLIREKK